MNVVHGVQKEVLVDGQFVQVVAPHPFLYGSQLDHRQPHREHLVLLACLQRVEQLHPQQFQLFGGQQGHRFGVFQHYFIAGAALLQEERVHQLHCPALVQEDAPHFDVPVLRALAHQIRQAVYNAFEDAADLIFGQLLPHFAKLLYFVEKAVGVEFVAEAVGSITCAAEREGVTLDTLEAEVAA